MWLGEEAKTAMIIWFYILNLRTVFLRVQGNTPANTES